MPEQQPKDPFSTQEQALLDAVGAHIEYAHEYRQKIGEEAVRSMVTVVWRPRAATNPDSEPFETIDHDVRVPEDFVPNVATDAGYGDRLYFLKDNEAAPVFDKKDRELLIVNRGGVPEEIKRPSRRALRKLAKQGVTIRNNPLPQPHSEKTKAKLDKITPSI